MHLTRGSIIALIVIGVLGLCWLDTAVAESYCYITDVEHQVVSNAIQITAKADGILDLDWPGGDNDGVARRILVRFDNARLKLEDHFVEVDTAPVSTIRLYKPQDADEGIGVMMEVCLTDRSRYEGRLSTDERTFVLTIDAPLRTAGEDEKEEEKKEEAEEILSVEEDDGLVSVRALRADIHEVVAQIARKTGLSMTLDDAVKHKVNINLRGMKPLEVVQAIAAGYGLALSTKGDVHMLSEGVPRDLTTYNRSGTASFPMRYLQAEDAKELLPTFLIKYLHANEEQNAVVATAPQQMLDKIGHDLESVDQPPPLIMIEVVAVELTDTGDYERDISWLYRTHDKAFGTDSALGTVDYRGTDAGGLTGGVIENTARLTTTITALESEGKAEIRSNPRIAAVNGKPADIFIGKDRFILVKYEISGQQQERIEAVPVGVRLHVVPWTGGNGEITVTLNVEVSNISEIDPATGLPLLSTRDARSTVRTRDGETIVIGGLRQQQKETTRQKIPILGDIPVIGSLFESKTTSSVNTELVIFVTPRILSTDGQLRGVRQRELRERLLRPGDLGYEAPDERGEASGQ